MIEINGKKFCENCFKPVTGVVCKSCGFNSEEGSPDPTTLSPGSILMNRYVVGCVIGKGGFGITYLAYDALVNKKIAIKEYYPYGLAQRVTESTQVAVTSSDSAEAFNLGAEKFYNEAKLVSRFNGNPNIVGVYGCFYENGTAYIAMEYLKGQTLKEYIRENGVLSAPKALFVAKNIVNALIVAHSASVLHRDITPDNVILCENGDIKLIDFGAARQVVAEYSQTFSVILKPGFAPPEQYRKKGNQGPWTDVYALGTTLYFMLTGDIPEDPTGRFDDDDTFKDNNFDVEPALWAVITKAAKLDIDERYKDALELKNALDEIEITPEPIISPTDTPSENSEISGNVSAMNVSIKPPKQSFFKRHLRTIIEIACGAAAAAVIIPLAIMAFKPAKNADDNFSESSSQSIDSSAVATLGNKPDIEAEGFSKPLYSCLSGDTKALYEYIYTGIISNEKNIVVPSLTYKVSDIGDVFDFVLNDNPYFNDTQGFNLNYNDLNNNREPDPDEYVNSISPIYTGIDRMEANDYILNSIHETGGNNDDRSKIQLLCDIHDMILNNVQHIPRNSTPTASCTHGVLIDHAADDLGVARTLCDYAQRLGFESFVFDTDFGGKDYTAMVRIKIGDKWYNISTFIDSLWTEGTVNEIPLTEEGKITHFWFLFCDDPIAMGAINLQGNYGEEFAPILPFLISDETDTENTDEETVSNYYIEVYLNKALYGSANEETYNALLEETKAWFDSKDGDFEFYLTSDCVDDFWKIIRDTYIADLSEKYKITVSDFSGVYTGDAIRFTFET